MKIFIISFFILSNIFAQSEFSIIGGYNMSRIKYNDDDTAENFDMDSKGGINIGIEQHVGNLIVGASFLQRGAKFEFTMNGYDFEGYDSYNYGAVHLLFPSNLGDGLEVFGGVQAGISLGGEVHLESGAEDETEDIDSDDLNFGAGLLIGANYMINEQIGLRASYYLGLTDVSPNLDSDLNFKNNTFSFSVLINI